MNVTLLTGVFGHQIEDIKDSPLNFLNMAMFNVASSLKTKNRDYEVHFKLAQLLEEKYYFEAFYGMLEKSVRDFDPLLTSAKY